MDVSSLREEIETLHEQALPTLESGDDYHKRLFEAFARIEAALIQNNGDDDAENADKASNLIEAQTVVIRTAAALPARSMNDLLYKLALWRWDSAGLDVAVEEMTRANAIAYSAFRDLAKMLGDNAVLKDFDRNN